MSPEAARLLMELRLHHCTIWCVPIDEESSTYWLNGCDVTKAYEEIRHLAVLQTDFSFRVVSKEKLPWLNSK